MSFLYNYDIILFYVNIYDEKYQFLYLTKNKKCDILVITIYLEYKVNG